MNPAPHEWPASGQAQKTDPDCAYSGLEALLFGRYKGAGVKK
jgi:hypothetical protein